MHGYSDFTPVPNLFKNTFKDTKCQMLDLSLVYLFLPWNRYLVTQCHQAGNRNLQTSWFRESVWKIPNLSQRFQSFTYITYLFSVKKHLRAVALEGCINQNLSKFFIKVYQSIKNYQSIFSWSWKVQDVILFKTKLVHGCFLGKR